MVSTGNASEILGLLESIGGKKPEYLKTWLFRIATTAGLSERVVEDAFQGQYVSKKTVWKLRQAVEKTRNDDANTIARVQSLIARLEAGDVDFNQPDIDALRALLGRNRNLDKGAD